MRPIPPSKSADAPQPSIAPQPRAASNLVQRHLPKLYAFWKFSRPHTVIGTSLSAVGLFLLASVENSRPIDGWSLLIWLGALVACLCGNVYIVGLNQLEDVAIDRVNKPHLPIASGEFSRRQGWAIVGITGSLALLLSAWQGAFLLATVWISVLIGTAYSLPPIRLKRFPIWAALCIFSVRGAIVNLGLFLHFNQRLGGMVQIPATVWCLTVFILVFTFAIAIFKDIPDLEGDRQYKITTFTIRLGAPAVFNLARWVLTICYVGMIGAGFLLPGVNGMFLSISHLLLLGLLWWRSRSIDLQHKSEVARFYQFIWKLFFLEYLLFPVAVGLGSLT
ncbi:MAG: homogentisate phytyltransferase [Elainella sp. Prado103]|jgi:homogentisate phytyltransferase/homogentisate geranylgeranyltransferase|nr:homogentisate phytyltransferase [Elainella sp. Prado103]